MKNYGMRRLFPTAVLIILTASIACSGPTPAPAASPQPTQAPTAPDQPMEEYSLAQLREWYETLGRAASQVPGVAGASLDKKARRIRLGLKQLSDDPWASLARAFKRGSVIEGEVSSKTDFGVFLRVQGGIEGLIANNQLAEPIAGAIDKMRDEVNVGDHLKAVVTEVSADKQRLSLSLRELQRREERQELVKYIHDDEEPDRVSLGEFLRDRTND